MHWFDGIAAVLVIALAVRGYGRGLIQQVSALLAVALGLLGGLYLHSAAAAMMPSFGPPVLGLVAAFTVVFVAVALSVNLLARVLRSVVYAMFLGVVDRILGALLGALVGVQVLLVLVLLVGRYLPEGPGWLAGTRAAPLLYSLLEQVLPVLPDHFREFFDQQGAGPGDLLRRFDGLRREAGTLLDRSLSPAGG